MQSSEQRPSKYADYFLSLFCKDELLEEVKGDLHEYYFKIRKRRRGWQAYLIYWYQVFQFIRPFALKSKFKNSTTLIMFKSNLKFAWRNLLKHKKSSLLKLSSLALGIACFVFTFIYVQGELSYDRFHPDADQIHRVAIDFVDDSGNRLPDATTPPALAPALKETFPEVATSVRLFPNWGRKFLVGTSPDRRFYEEGVIRTDSTFFDIFSFPVLHGSTASALDVSDQMVLTKSAALKYFGKEDVVGESLTIYGGQDRTYQISAVLEDVPVHSHFKFDFLVRLPFNRIDQNWGWYNYYTYIKLNPDARIANLEPKLQPFFESFNEDNNNIIYSQPLTDIHLRSNLKWELEANGSMTNVYIFSILAVFVLFISCLNYLNLSIAESMKRFKEVGVRKVFGASKRMLVGQFLVETVLITLVSFLIGSALSELFFANSFYLLEKEVSIFDPTSRTLLLSIGGLILLVGILAGLFPAIYASSFKSILAMKGILNKSRLSTQGIRRGLLVLQFAISSFMIFGTIAVYQQLKHMQNKDKGFDTEQVLVLENAGSITNQESLKNELGRITGVQSVSASSGVIGGLNWTTRVGYPDAFTMNYVVTDPAFTETMEFDFVAGRPFSYEFTSDSQGFTMIVNETGLRELGLTYDDIGKSLPIDQEGDTTIVNGTIIGVVKDFHFTDYKLDIKPFAFFYRGESQSYLNLRLATTDIKNTLDQIEATWAGFSNGAPADYFFLDDKFRELIEEEARLTQLMTLLSGLAIFIAFMGMFAIANMTIRDKTKEIAIRKVLGASVSGVVRFITSKFMLLVLIANVIACPLAYLAVNSWLEGFAYRMTIGISLFVFVILISLVVGWLSVGFQSMKAATNNPVDSLHDD